MMQLEEMKYGVLENVKIVLVGTTHPGNVGAAARAMKAMGFARMGLVSPRDFPSAEATARAAGADDVLAGAAVHATLSEAVADCALVFGTSARLRNLSCPTVSPEQAAEDVLTTAAGDARAAIVFGRESSGLSNEDLDLCNRMIVIPTVTGFSSLNLAFAVQIVCYTIYRMLSNSAESNPMTGESVTSGDMDLLYAHLEESMLATGFLDPDCPRQLMRRMKRLYNRAGLDRNEYNILRGFLASIQDAVRKK